MKKLTEVGTEIFVVERLLDRDFCNHILQITEQFQLEQAGIELKKIDTQIRSNSSLYLDTNHSLLKSTNDLLLKKVGVIQKLLYQHYGIGFFYSETCTILRYEPGQFYKRHVDNLLLRNRFDEASKGIPIRDVSIVGYLNEDFEGGETYFDRQNLKLKPEMGNVAVFPAFWTHPHQSLPVTKGVKYSFVTWLYH
ncbi:MAG: 2OG-Fe(II) oxygenase [Prochloraceae cyanobacterium]|nr:2OG-Fe(II) oxygenase [Prochloraceae cyanobacterium]